MPLWPIYVLSALAAGSIETVLDKVAVLDQRDINPWVAAFYRSAIFVLFVALIGVMGIAGSLHFIFNWKIVLVASLSAPGAYLYTLLLKRVEITGIFSSSYISPIVFLVIDSALLHLRLTPFQLMGIAALLLGGAAFVFDGVSKELKTELSAVFWISVALDLSIQATEIYSFKALNTSDGVSGVSFVFSTWTLVTLGTLGVVLVQGRAASLTTTPALRYATRVLPSKLFDAAAFVLSFHALSFAAASQVSAVETIAPMVLFLTTLLAQRVLNLELGERLRSRDIVWKLTGAALMCTGTWFTR